MATSSLLNSSSPMMRKARSRGCLAKHRVEQATYTAPSVRVVRLGDSPFQGQGALTIAFFRYGTRSERRCNKGANAATTRCVARAALRNWDCRLGMEIIE